MLKTVIKKHQSWPVGVPRDEMQAKFDWPEVNVGDVDAISGMKNGVPLFLWGMKEPIYFMQMMADGGPSKPDYLYKMASRAWKHSNEEISTTFQYSWPFD